MKYALLSLTVLLSTQAYAVTYEEAAQELAMKNASVEAAEKRVERLRGRTEAEHQLTESISGKHEYSDDMEKRKRRVRSNIAAHNKAVEEHEKSLAELKECLAKHGKKWQIRSAGNGYELLKNEERELEPIVTRPAEAAQVRTVRRVTYK
jgi:hypothetical protein